LCVLFIFACKRNECTGFGFDGVSITVVNKSGQLAKKIIFVTPNGSKHRMIVCQPIENDSRECINYKSAGESSYSLLVILENGDTIQSKERYAEGGYVITETIKKDRIISSYNNY